MSHEGHNEWELVEIIPDSFLPNKRKLLNDKTKTPLPDETQFAKLFYKLQARLVRA